MSRPFWWPMAEPPLPNHKEDVKNGWPWIEKTAIGIGVIRNIDPKPTAENLAMEDAA